MNFDNTQSHMPFLMVDGEGNRILFFCLADGNNVWKLHVSVNDGEPQRIETGLSPDMVECSPTAWQDETGWHVTFIAGGSFDSIMYHLYRMDGTTLATLSRPVAIRPTRAGFIYQDRLVTAELFDRFTIHDRNLDRTIGMPGMYIYRVAYRADNPDKLLVSGAWINETDSLFTVEYDVTTGDQHLIACDGKPAYKCTIYGDEVIDTIQTGGHFENRRIRKAERITTTSCRILTSQPDDNMVTQKVRTCRCKKRGSQNPEPASRPGCLECVEKHLGAAMVILSEIHAGYAWHLRLIGHLHEAEEESQDWDALFRLIRKARKAYQTANIIPDWEIIAQELANVKGNINAD
ncbi:MAG: hypothetical protein FWH27_05370 [Planctomycetaceae bacterium]|nr:hypothetical protein [Planctomycetaceae bacterium]